MAIAVPPRGHGLRVRLGEGDLRVAQGRWDPRDPVQASLGERLPVVLAREGAIGHQRGGSVGSVQRRHVRPDDLAARWRITASAAERFHEPGNPGMRRDHPFQPDVIEVRPMSPTLAARDVHDVCVGGGVAVIAAIARATGALERRNARGKAQTLGSRGRHAAIESGDAIIIERLESPTERIIMQLRGFNQASVCPGTTEAPGRVVGSPSRGPSQGVAASPG
jgi:hypothetical protein